MKHNESNSGLRDGVEEIVECLKVLPSIVSVQDFYRFSGVMFILTLIVWSQ